MAEEAILKYLESTNRPYSANDIVLNLHKQWGKTGVQKALDCLVATNSVLEKTYGKQKVYVIRQPDAEQSSMNQALKEIEVKIEESLPELQEIEDKLKVTEGILKGLQSTMTTSQILKEIDDLKTEIHELSASLENASKDKTPIDPKLLNDVKQEFSTNVKEYRKRKRICMDIFNAIFENYPKSKKTLIEELGIETDESVNFKLEDN